MNIQPAKNQPLNAPKNGFSTTASNSVPGTSVTNNTSLTISLESYLENLKKQNSSEATIRNYRSDINQFLEFCKTNQLSPNQKENVDKFEQSQREKQLKDASIRRKTVSISSYLAWVSQASQKLKIEPAKQTNLPTINNIQPKDNQNRDETAGDFVVPIGIEKVLNQYLTTLKYNTISDATIRNYRSDIKQFAFFTKADSVVTLLSLEQLKRFAYSQKEKGLKPTSIQRKLVSITQFALWAQRRKLISGVTSDWSSLALDVIFNKADGPIVVTAPEKTDVAQDVKKKRRKESWLAALILLLLLFGSTIGLYLVQTVQDLRQRAYVDPNQNQQITTTTTTTTTTTDKRTLPFRGRLFSEKTGQQITGSSKASFRLYNNEKEEGEPLWESGVCDVATNPQGIFDILLGGKDESAKGCGNYLTDEIYFGNTNLWLSSTIDGEVLASYMIKTNQYAEDSGLLAGYPIGDPVVKNSVLFMNEYGEILFADQPTFSVPEGDLTLSGDNLYFITEGRGGVFSDSLITAPYAYLGGFDDTALVLQTTDKSENPLMSWIDPTGESLGVIDANGNVGIGTSKPAGLLGLGKNGAYITTQGDDLLFYDETTGALLSLSQLAVDNVGSNYWNQSGSSISYSAGNIGIGTATPEQALNVVGNIQLGIGSSDRYIYFDNGTASNAGIRYNSATSLIEFSNNGTTWEDFGSGKISSVSNSDGTLTISPTTGDVVASLNLSHANSWTGAQTFTTNTNFPNSGIWNSSGNVGIGTSAPNAPLDVRGTGVVARFAGQVVGADAVNTDEFVTLAQLNAIGAPSGIAGQNTYWETNDTLGSEAYTATVRGGLGADVTPGSAGELLYSVSGTSYGTLAAGAADQVLSIDGAGMPSWLDLSSLLIAGNDIDIVGTIIAVQDDLDLSSISASTDLGFSIYDNGGVLGLSLQDATGNIGIGTASPEQKLTAEGNLQLGTTDGTRYIYFDNGTTDNAGIRYNSTTGRLQFSDGGTIWNSFGTGDGTVTSVTNSDGSLTIFPTDGDVIAALNLGNANDWTAQQTFAGNVGINSLTTSAALTFGADTVAAGGISFGGDTNLYRSAASTLKTDDSFILGTVGTGTTSTVVTREVSGLLAARNIDARVWDGSLVGGSGTAGYVPYWSDIDTLSAEQYLSTTRGGLGGDVTALGAGELLYSTGTNTYDSVAAGTADQLLLSGGTGSPSWSNIASLLTAGDDIDITGTTNATISLEDDISLSALRASAISGLSFYDDGGNLAMFIADQGNVGIGTNTPDTVFHIDVGSNNRDIKISADAGFNTGIDLFSGTQYSQIIQETTGELSLKNRNSDENIQFIINDGGVTTTAAVIQGSSGNLGIGTSSPEQLLTVNGNIQLGVTDADRYIYFDNGTGTNAGFRYNSTSNVLEFSNNGVLWDAFGSASGSVTSVSNADGTLTISPTTGDVTASLNLGNANSWTGAQTFTANTYFPGTGIWDTNGNVGIGTASPLAKLSVGQSGTASSTLTQSSSGDLALTGSYWNGVAEALHSFKLQNIASTTVNEAGRLAFNWDSSELLTLESGGNVGIGTTTPTQKLDVAGAVRLGASGGGYDTLNTSAAAGAPSGDLYWGNRTVIDSSNISNFGVSSVTNSDGSITVSPTTGDVVSSLNVGHANDWTAQQTFAGNVGINSLTTSAALTFGADTVAAGGISFGGDTNLYRSAIGTLTTNGDVIISGGNVGIGATGELYLAAIDTLRTPDSLTVDGTFSIGTAAAGTTDDVLVLEGDGSVAKRAIDSRIWGSSLIDGSGTTNYLPKFSDLDTVTDSQLFDNGVNVGIGTALPSQKLDITGAVRLGAAGGANDVLNTSPTVGAPSGDLYWGSRTIIDSDNIQDFGVTSLTNSDGTLTISPTTGDVVASLNLGNANSWTGAQTFTTDTYFPGTSIWSSAGNIGLGTITTTSKLNFATGITAAAGINFGGDVTLYRSAADTLKTDDNFSTAGSINLGTAAIGTTNSVITREVGGDLTARSIDGRVWGSSLVDGSGTADYISYWSDANTLTSEQYLNVVRGGLGNNLTALGAGELLYSTGTTTYDSLAAGSASQLLISNGAAAPSWSNVTSLLTAGDDIDITGTTNATVSLEDDINISNLRASSIAGLALYDDAGVLGLFLQDATGNIGIGDATPIQKLDVAGAVRLGANGGTYDVLNTTPASNPPSGDLYWGDRQLIDSASIGDYGVTTLTNSDGTLTISPDTGDVVASLNLANTNTWTGLQTFNNTYTDFSAYLRHAGDGDTFLYFTDNNINVSAGGKSLLTLTENAVQDLVKLGDGTDVDVNLNDKVFVEGSSGYVGIGTASPLAKLSVGQSGTASSTLTQSSSGDLALTGSYWNGVAEALHSFKLQNIASTTVNEAGRLAFNWDSSELLTLESGGNVGIGTTTPGAKLSFAADTLATGGIDFGGDTNLYRSAVGMLTTDGDLTVAGGNIGIGGTGELYLSAANTLRTPDSLTVDGTVNVGTVGVGTTDSVITREGTGDLSARSIDSRVWGSSLVDGSGTTGYVSYWSDANTLTAEQYLNVTRGGLGGDVTALGAGELLYSTGTTTYDSLAAGSASQLLISNGAAAPSWSNVTSLLTAGDDIDITGTTNATVTLEDDIDLTALRASSAAGLSIYDDGAVLGLFLQDATGNIGVGTNAPEQKLTADGNIQLGTTDATRYIYFDNGTANNAGFRYDAVTDALQFSDNGVAWTSFNTMGTGTVTSVTNSDGTLTISPTTGDVVASLNLGNANTWTGLQTFDNTYTDFAQYLRHAGDADTFFNFTTDSLVTQIGGKALISLTEDDVQDIIKLGDGTDNDINLNDDVFIEGSSGNVGIGTVSTSAKLTLEIGTTAAAGINFGGDTTLYRSAADTLKTDDSFVLGTAGTGTTDSVITREASGLLSARSIDSRVWGSSLVDGSGTTGYVSYWSDANTLTAEQYLNVTRGGLGGDVTALGAGELLYSTGTTTYDSLAAGSASQLLISNGAAAPSWSNVTSLLTAGDDIDITGTTNATVTLEDDIDVSVIRASSINGISFYDDGAVLGLFLQDATGNIGVGTFSPEQKLTADGNLQLGLNDATRYIYFDNGTANNAGFRYNSSTDVMEYSDDGLGWTAFSDAVGGLWTQSGSDIYYNTGNVGIGTATPEESLNTTGDIQLGTTDGTRYVLFDNGTAYNAGIRYNSTADALQFSNDGSTWYDLGTGIGTNYWTQTGSSIYYTTGNVGIGTSNPQAKLDIAGASSTISNTSGDISLNAASGSISLSGDSLTNALNGYFRGKIGIGTATPEKSLTTTGDIQLGTVNGTRYIYFDNGTANNAGIRYNSTSSVLEYSNNGTTWQGVGGGIWSQSGVDGYYSVGNIGIGTSTPASALQVLGDITPGTNDTYTLGTDTLRWKDLYLGPDSIYIGASGDQAGISYNTTSNYLSLDGNASGTDLAITAAGNVGVGSTNPLGKLQVDAADAATILNLRNTSNGGAWGMRLEGDGTTANNFHLDYGASTDKLVVRSNGYVGVPGYLGIGTTVPGARLHLVGASATTTTGGGYVTAMDIRYRGGRLEYGIDFLPELDGANSISFFNGAGTYVGGINNTVAATSYGTSSDARLKENIVESSLGLETLMRVNVRDFNFINDPTQKVNGFIAQELYQVYPDAVVVGGVDPKLNPWAVDYGRLTPLIISSVQDLAAKDLSINEYGELNIAGNSVETYAIATPTGFINRLSAYSDLMVARLKAGFIQVRELTADNITIAGQSLYDYITGIVDSRIASQPTTNPTGDADLSTLTVTNEVSGDAVLTADNNGNISALGKLSTNELEVSGASKLGSLVVTNDTEIQGDLTTTNLNVAQDATISGTLVANNVETVSSRVSYLEGRIAEFEDVKAITANVVDATVSGTLYANDIYNFDSMVAEAFKQPSLVATILGDVEQINPFTGFDLSTANAQNLNLALSDLDLAAEDIVIAPSAVFINDYLKVNGSGYIAGSLGINENLIVGDGIQIGNGAIAYKPTTGGDSVFYIQPDGTGTLSFMANLMTLTADGVVTISGDLRVAGAVDIAGEARVETSLLTNLIKPLDKNSPIQLQLGEEASMAGKVNNSRFEIVDELGTPVATISAAGKADFAGGVGVQRGDVTLSSPGIFTTTKTAGKAYLPAGTSHVTIKSESITADTLIYVTPLGSTNNQVLFVKNQIAEDQSTIVKEGNFVVGLDFPLTQDVEFNWWIVQ